MWRSGYIYEVILTIRRSFPLIVSSNIYSLITSSVRNSRKSPSLGESKLPEKLLPKDFPPQSQRTLQYPTLVILTDWNIVLHSPGICAWENILRYEHRVMKHHCSLFHAFAPMPTGLWALQDSLWRSWNQEQLKIAFRIQRSILNLSSICNRSELGVIHSAVGRKGPPANFRASPLPDK
jgi:hypothetical protein